MCSRSAMPLRCAAMSGTTWSWTFWAGKSAIRNLQLPCGSCNRIKDDRGMEYLRVKLQL